MQEGSIMFLKTDGAIFIFCFIVSKQIKHNFTVKLGKVKSCEYVVLPQNLTKVKVKFFNRQTVIIFASNIL